MQIYTKWHNPNHSYLISNVPNFPAVCIPKSHPKGTKWIRQTYQILTTLEAIVVKKNYKESATAEHLLSVIQQHQTLLIASDGSKSSEKSGGGWIIADVEGRELLSGFNPDFGDITQINSHRAEIYEALSVFMFLHKYCKFYKMNLQSPIKYYCDNKENVTKLSNITERNRNYNSSNSKSRI